MVNTKHPLNLELFQDCYEEWGVGGGLVFFQDCYEELSASINF